MYALRKLGNQDPSAVLSEHQASQSKPDAPVFSHASAAELAGSCDVSLESYITKHHLLPAGLLC